jgi:hypothetical protein
MTPYMRHAALQDELLLRNRPSCTAKGFPGQRDVEPDHRGGPLQAAISVLERGTLHVRRS